MGGKEAVAFFKAPFAWPIPDKSALAEQEQFQSFESGPR
jgi:hypothetical protein